MGRNYYINERNTRKSMTTGKKSNKMCKILSCKDLQLILLYLYYTTHKHHKKIMNSWYKDFSKVQSIISK